MAAAPDDVAADLDQRIDQIVEALEAPTPEQIEAIADYAERQARADRDVLRAAVGRAFALALRDRAGRARGPLS